MKHHYTICLLSGLFLSASFLSGCNKNHSFLEESSGLSRSLLYQGAYWTHNDSANLLAGSADSSLYRIDGEGNLIERVSLNVSNRDWEDIAQATLASGRSVILLADIGDNEAKHELYQIHVLNEKAPTSPPVTLTFIYKDGRSRDAEGVAIDPRTGEVLIISKREKPARIYSIGTLEPLTDTHRVAVPVATLPLLPRPTWLERAMHPFSARYADQPTGLDISPNGGQLAISSYQGGFLWSRAAGQTWNEVMRDNPPKVLPLPFDNYEGVAFDGDSIVVIAEGAQELKRIQRPEK